MAKKSASESSLPGAGRRSVCAFHWKLSILRDAMKTHFLARWWWRSRPSEATSSPPLCRPYLRTPPGDMRHCALPLPSSAGTLGSRGDEGAVSHASRERGVSIMGTAHWNRSSRFHKQPVLKRDRATCCAHSSMEAALCRSFLAEPIAVSTCAEPLLTGCTLQHP